jgi:UrcA family protein
MIRIVASAVCVAAAVFAVPAMAQDAKTVRVIYTDLDLTNAAGVEELQHRVKWALGAVCGAPDLRDLTAVQAAAACRKQARVSSQTQIALAVDHAEQLALRGGTAQIASR